MNKLTTAIIILFCLVLFVLLSQPVWWGKEMVTEYRSDCDKRGGVLLEYIKILGTTYQCVSRLDKGDL